MNSNTTPEAKVKVLDRIIEQLEERLYVYMSNLEDIRQPIYSLKEKDTMFLNESKELKDFLNVLDHSLDMRAYYRSEEILPKFNKK